MSNSNTVVTDTATVERAVRPGLDKLKSEEPRNGDFQICVDQLTQDAWETALTEFSDANIYQTWAYGAARSADGDVSRVAVKRGGRVVGLAQVRIARLPFALGGVAHVLRGPVWQRKGEPSDGTVLRHLATVLRDEFAVRQRLYLKIVPNVFSHESGDAIQHLTAAGLTHIPGGQRTLLLDLKPSLPELRAGFRKSWRRGLDRAEKLEIEMTEETSVEAYEAALAVHRSMHKRKKYAEFADMEDFQKVQRELPSSLKLRIVLCKFQGKVVSALGWSIFGDVGVPVIGATDGAGLQINASSLMWWRMIGWMKAHGFRYCDLAGINPERNPGSYIFKAGMCKRHGFEASRIGEFSFCESAISGMAYRTGTWMRHSISCMRLAVERFRKRSRDEAKASDQRME